MKPLPSTFAATRAALHRVAEELVAPARKPPNEIALTQTPGGFGTPPFDFEGARTQVRVDGVELVVEADGSERRAVLDSIAAGGELLGPGLLPDGVPDDPAPLGIDAAAAERLADFYALGAEALKRFRERAPAAANPTAINLWPEHFDIALEAGSEDVGTRANYGASPGDEHHDEPYLYVGPWTAKVEGELWGATGFSGAELRYAELLGVEDPLAAALEFFEARRDVLAS